MSINETDHDLQLQSEHSKQSNPDCTKEPTYSLNQLRLSNQFKMQVALVMLLYFVMFHAGIAHTLPNLMFQAQDADLPYKNALFQAQDAAPHAPTHKCNPIERLNYLAALPNGIECVLSLRTILFPIATELEKVNARIKFCTKDCGEAFMTFLETSCNDQNGANEVKMICNFQTKF